MSESQSVKRRPWLLESIESGFGILWYALLALVPVIAWLVRLVGGSDLPYQNEIVFHLIVMITALAGSYAESQNQHLSLNLGLDKKKHPLIKPLIALRNAAGSFMIIQYIIGSLEMLFVAFLDELIMFIPIQVFIAFIPLGFTGIFYHWLKRNLGSDPWWAHLAGILAGIVTALPSLLNIMYATASAIPDWIFTLEGMWYSVIPPVLPVMIVLLILLAPTGLPLYIVLGGIATLLFLRGGVGPGVVLYDGYAVLDNSAISSIALFTLTGFLLSESKASERFIEVFLALFGWMPGGMVLAAILVSAVFTTFTGASGVTILALGGLLYAVLHGSGRYNERFSIGVLTSSGSIGLLFPPSLAIILYGSVAGINIRNLFIAGILPGILMVLSRSVFGIAISMKNHNKAVPFEPKRALKAVVSAAWELMIPLLTIGLYFTGAATLLETAAITLMYTVVIEVVVKREIRGRMLYLVILKSMRIIGGVLVILMLAKGLSTFIIDAQIPQNLALFAQENIASKLVFLLMLTGALLITGTLMDIYSAIFVVVPLIVPLGQVFGIDPLHLGIIFLANLELGFITPPVGLNLFLSSYRFQKGLPEVYRSIIPFLILQFAVVLIITYVPWISLALVP